MRRPWLGLFLCFSCFVGCAAGPAAQRPSAQRLPPLPRRHHDPHLAKDELRWAGVRNQLAEEDLGEQARAAFAREDWAVAHARALELEESRPGALAAQGLLWVFATSAAEVGEAEHTERALVSLLCTEAAPSPLLEGPVPRGRLLGGSPCTPTPLFPPGPAGAPDLVGPGPDVAPFSLWLLLARAQWDSAEDGWAHDSFVRTVRLAPAGSDARSEARIWLIEESRDYAAIFRMSVALVDEGGRTGYVDQAIDRAAHIIAAVDWDRDGRKDTRSGLLRADVARWLATDPPGAIPIITRVLEVLLEANRCADARRVHRRLVRIIRRARGDQAPTGRFTAPLAACPGR